VEPPSRLIDRPAGGLLPIVLQHPWERRHEGQRSHGLWMGSPVPACVRGSIHGRVEGEHQDAPPDALGWLEEPKTELTADRSTDQLRWAVHPLPPLKSSPQYGGPWKPTKLIRAFQRRSPWESMKATRSKLNGDPSGS
jgi:hypothetical protein